MGGLGAKEISVSFGTSHITLEQVGWRGAGRSAQVPSLRRVSVVTTYETQQFYDFDLRKKGVHITYRSKTRY